MKWLYRLAFGEHVDWFDVVQFVVPLMILALAAFIALAWK